MKFEVVRRAQEFFAARYEAVTVDGVRVVFPDGWGLVRASNTQPLLVLRFEATTQARLDEIQKLVRGKVDELLREVGAVSGRCPARARGGPRRDQRARGGRGRATPARSSPRTRSRCAIASPPGWSRSSATPSPRRRAAAPVDLRAAGRIGVGVAGQCLGASGVVLNAPNLGWRDVPFGELLRGAVGVPVRIANDLSVAAWGEKRFGAAQGLDDVVLVFVGSGVGCGAHPRRAPARGRPGRRRRVRPPEGPPLPSTAALRPCGCGQRGCLEAYTSGMNVAARIREELAAGAATSLLSLAGGDPARLSAAIVEDGYAAGDAYARALWDEVVGPPRHRRREPRHAPQPGALILGGGVLLGCPAARRARAGAVRRGGVPLRDEGAHGRARLARRRRRRDRRGACCA